MKVEAGNGKWSPNHEKKNRFIQNIHVSDLFMVLFLTMKRYYWVSEGLYLSKNIGVNHLTLVSIGNSCSPCEFYCLKIFMLSLLTLLHKFSLLIVQFLSISVSQCQNQECCTFPNRTLNLKAQSNGLKALHGGLDLFPKTLTNSSLWKLRGPGGGGVG